MSKNSDMVDFCNAHLKEMCEEIEEMESTSILRSDGFVRQLAHMYHDEFGIDGSSALSIAESMVKKCAVHFVVKNS